LKLLKNDYVTTTAEKVKHKKVLDKLAKERMNLHNEQVRLEDNRDKLYKLKDQVKHGHDEKSLKKTKKRYIRTGKNLAAQLGKIKSELHKVDKKVTEIDLEEMELNIRKIDDKEQEIEKIKQQIELQKQKLNEYKALIKTNKSKIKKLLDNNEKFQKERQKYINIVDYLNVVREVCKDENIKQYAISSIMPFLNQKTNYYLSEVGYSFYTVLNKWIEAEIKGPGVKDASYGSLSGGEGRGIDLALQFSLLDIARVQAGTWPDILVLDEVLDSSVDRPGIDKLLSIIRTKQDQEDNKIFIISHRNINFIEAENTYFVTKSDYSKVEVK
jgi:DNA repair exonuclease SbcCD ATPase subunit